MHRKVALNDNVSLTKQQWYELDPCEFDEYRMYHGKVVAPHGTTATSVMKTTDPVAEFKRGIK